MNIKYKIDDNLFILENSIDDESILNSAIQECIDSESNGDFLARFGICNIETQDGISFSKTFEELSDIEKFIFSNSDFIKNEKLQIERKDLEINPNNSTKTKLTQSIIDLVSKIYPELEGNLIAEYDSVIKYSNGYKMNAHRDNGGGRVCTAVLYLNSKLETDKGGDVIFYDNDDLSKEILKYEPVKNDLIIFDSHYNEDTLEHSVTEIINWDRYVYRVYVTKK